MALPPLPPPQPMRRGKRKRIENNRIRDMDLLTFKSVIKMFAPLLKPQLLLEWTASTFP